MLVAFATAFVLSVCLIRALMPLATHIGLVDTPCVRKRHVGSVPLVGGLAIYITLVPLCLIFPYWRANNGLWLLTAGLPLLFIGLCDDKWQVSARTRLLFEIFCSLFAVLYCGTRIHDIGNLIPGVGGTLVLLSIPMSVLGMVGLINAVNMTDGVDGLAGGLATLSFGALAVLTFPAKLSVSLQLISLVAALFGFLIFNSRFFGRARASVFMGDGGAMFIGFALAWYLISLSQGPEASISPVSALWLVAIPLLDTVTIMTRRLVRGQSPFAADREHLHHILMLAGFGANRTVLAILSLQFMCITVGMASIYFKVADHITFALFVCVATLYYTGMCHAWKLMKRVKAFREWAGFEDRRSETQGNSGRRTRSERRTAQIMVSVDARCSQDRRASSRRPS